MSAVARETAKFLPPLVGTLDITNAFERSLVTFMQGQAHRFQDPTIGYFPALYAP